MNYFPVLHISTDGLLTDLLASNDEANLKGIADAARTVANCGGSVNLWNTTLAAPIEFDNLRTPDDVGRWLNDINTRREAKGEAAI